MPFQRYPLPRFSYGSQRVLVTLTLLAIASGLFLFMRGEAVNVVTAERGELRQAVVASGRVRTPQRIEIAAQISGKVLAVEAREGAALAADQVLLRLDAAEWQANAAQSRAALVQSEARLRQISELGLPVAEQNLQQAEANASQAQRHFDRVGQLVAKGFYSSAQLDDAKRARDVAESQLRAAQLQRSSNRPGGSDVLVARSSVEQAKAALLSAESRLAYATLRAPVAGTVLTRTVETGDTAQPGKVLMVLAPTGETELTAQIDEKNLSLLRAGQQAQVSADAYPGERFKAEISYIAPSVDAQRGSVEIRLRVPQAPVYLKHEMTVSIDIETARRSDALLVAADAVNEANSAQPWVMLVRDGKTQRQAVRLGVRGAGKLEILDGLAAGDVLVPAALRLPEGRRIRTVNR